MISRTLRMMLMPSIWLCLNRLNQSSVSPKIHWSSAGAAFVTEQNLFVSCFVCGEAKINLLTGRQTYSSARRRRNKPESGVRDHASRRASHSSCKRLRTILDKDLSKAGWRRCTWKKPRCTNDPNSARHEKLFTRHI